MMNEKTPTPIESMAALLAEMTERAMEAERERDAAKDDSDQWYLFYQNAKKKLKEVEAALAKKTEENEELQSAIKEYIESIEKGAQKKNG